jgi:integration host factor subunit beta
MTKSSLIKRLAHKTDKPIKDAEIVVNAVFDLIASSLESGQRVELRGFGSFGLKERKSRTGRNPKTGEAVSVASKRVMFFRAGKELRERVDGKND